MKLIALEHARAALATLPLVYAGLIEFEILPLEPCTGFARLFNDQTDTSS